MKGRKRKIQIQKSNVLSLVDNAKFKIKQAESSLFSYTLNFNVFLFQKGDVIICRQYNGEDLSPNAIVVARTERSDKTLTSVANAVEIFAIVIAYRREVFND